MKVTFGEMHLIGNKFWRYEMRVKRNTSDEKCVR